MHVYTNFYYLPDYSDVYTTMERFGALGLEVTISEMDTEVDDITLTEKMQGDIFHDMVAACRDAANCEAVTFWGFTDKYTWLGSEYNPLLFDENYNKKEAYFEVKDALLWR